MKLNKLTPDETRVIVNKGTEAPFTGKYYSFDEPGVYTCKHCGAALYRSTDKFQSSCGWPSFDDEIPGAVKRSIDADGSRTEITCARCGAHLGHVFLGEGFTDKNTRHCVNSISMNFIPASDTAAIAAAMALDNPVPSPASGMMATNVSATMPMTDTAYYAGGCFWGVEYMLQQEEGVQSVVSGYMGGHVANPTYEQVCTGTTGHAETVQVVFDPSKVSYEKLTKLFFEIHDPTELNRQGPDRGYQYRSAVFYKNDEQKQTTEKLINILKGKGYKVVTEVAPAGPFYQAEAYHQDYYDHTGKRPYCHAYVKRF